MSDIVVKAEHLSKSYLVGHQRSEQGSYVALREVIANGVRNFARKGADFFAGRQIVQGDEIEEFWALKDVNFEVREGEVFGIIGRNGAGKSTLLKVLSRITEPTKGEVRIKGRVASLLEVGTGFHPELTGRENIYLNGAILGMTNTEIRRKFDEIVAFAEVEQFLDTPVKRYSSGMYVRLAFAVAAHLEPEILLVDEVLAVGDAGFQRKCLGKMREVSNQKGRTVLFVSHNMGAVGSLCPRCILLAGGAIVIDGPAAQVIDRYIHERTDRKAIIDRSRSGKQIALISADVVGGAVNGNSVFWSNVFSLQFYYRAVDIPALEITFDVIDRHGRKVFVATSQHASARGGTNGLFVATAGIPARLLAPGDYYVTASLHQPNVFLYDEIDGFVHFTILADAPVHYRYGSDTDFGVVTLDVDWTIEKLDDAPVQQTA